MAAEPQMQHSGVMNVETRLEKVVPRTQDVKSFIFPRPEGFDYKAGQWMYVNIRIGGVSKMHHFTISASPTENYLMFTKKITDSEYSKALDATKAASGSSSGARSASSPSPASTRSWASFPAASASRRCAAY